MRTRKSRNCCPVIVQIPILPVRSGPGEKYPVVGLAAQRAKLMVECALRGQLVTGGEGSTDQWLQIGPKQYIPAAHVSAQGDDRQDGQKVSTQRCTTP